MSHTRKVHFTLYIVYCMRLKNSELYEIQFVECDSSKVQCICDSIVVERFSEVCDSRKVQCLCDSSPAIAVERFTGVVSGRAGLSFPTGVIPGLAWKWCSEEENYDDSRHDEDEKGHRLINWDTNQGVSNWMIGEPVENQCECLKAVSKIIVSIKK